MRKLTALLAAGLVLGTSGMATASGETSATATAAVSAEIITPLSITGTADLNFGKLAKPNSGVQVTSVVSTGGIRTGNADVVSGDTVTAAAFTIAGANSLAYTPTVSYTSAIATGVTLHTVFAKCGTTGSDQAISATGTGMSNCTTAVSGADTLAVGGTITINDTVTSGIITSAANISVKVAYN